MKNDHHLLEYLHDQLLETAKDISEEYETDWFPYRLMQSDGFMLGLAMVSVISALMSVAYAIGDLSRFL